LPLFTELPLRRFLGNLKPFKYSYYRAQQIGRNDPWKTVLSAYPTVIRHKFGIGACWSLLLSTKESRCQSKPRKTQTKLSRPESKPSRLESRHRKTQIKPSKPESKQQSKPKLSC